MKQEKSFDEKIGEYQEKRNRQEELRTVITKIALFVLGLILGFILGFTYR